MTCEHNRTMYVNAKSRDLNYIEIPHLNIVKDGYAPKINGVCHGDYIEFRLCLDCGTLLGYNPLSDGQLKQAFKVR